MRFSEKVPEYEIDLSLPESERWAEVIDKERESITSLVAEAESTVESLFGILYKAVKYLVGGKQKNHPEDEIASFSSATGVSKRTMMLLNRWYETSHMSIGFGIFGCTTGVVQLGGGRLVQVRTLDWPLRGMGRATRVFHFRNEERGTYFVAVGVPGLAGVFSGMVPGAYSVCINWLPGEGEVCWQSVGPALLLRKVLETKKSFSAAVKALQSTDLPSPVSFTVCGAKKGEACVIERTGSKHQTRKMTRKKVVQTNHFLSEKFEHLNEPLHDDGDDEYRSTYEDSCERYRMLARSLTNLKASADIADTILCLNNKEVLKEDTQQQIAFCPATSEYIVLRRVR